MLYCIHQTPPTSWSAEEWSGYETSHLHTFPGLHHRPHFDCTYIHTFLGLHHHPLIKSYTHGGNQKLGGDLTGISLFMFSSCTSMYGNTNIYSFRPVFLPMTHVPHAACHSVDIIFMNNDVL